MEYIPINLLLVRSETRAKELEKELGITNQISIDEFYGLNHQHANGRDKARTVIEKRDQAIRDDTKPLTVYIPVSNGINRALDRMERLVEEHRLVPSTQSSGDDYMLYCYKQPVIWFNI